MAPVPTESADDLETLRREVRDWARRRVRPLIGDIDRTQRFSWDLWERLRELEMFSLPFPEEVGGAGGTFSAYVAATEEVARAGAIAALYPGTTVQVADTLLRLGGSEAVRRWVPRLVSGEVVAAWAFTEAQTGSDPRQLRTEARRDGDDWILDGAKQFISYAGVCSVALVFAKTPGDRVGAFLVDTASPGWSTGPPVEVLGLGGGEPAPVYLEGVRVPADHVVGDPAGGFEAMLAGESRGKVRAAAICVGIAQRALDESVRYALERTHRDQPIGRKFASIQSHLAETQADVLAARALVQSVAAMVDRGLPVAREAAAARLVAGRTAREAAGSALQVCGAYGWTREMEVERLFRESKFFEVTQGSAEIQRAIVARELLRAGEKER
ncbi:acyl-CoA dehydrogenase family protein [Actinomadura sp. LOL_016]|uniref:acyl-CoA dehydrogenase family protein n=1 Tax=unclassified Actinomadura TaxID=2626254 RepID=UPI003A7FBCBD